MNPKVSIVVPVYNIEQYLPKCLESLTGQTLTEIEIILVNDGSTDNSLAVCQKYASSDPRIRCFSKPNGGLSDARNYGIRQAGAPLIGFVDSDDYIDLDFYRYLYEMLTENNADISVCGVKRFDESGIQKKSYGYSPEAVVDKKQAMYELIEGTKILNSVCNKLFKTELLRGIEFPVGKLYEDEFFSYKVFDRAERVAMGSGAYYYYRKNSNSITTVKFSDRELDRIEASVEKWEFCKQKYPDLVPYAERYIVYDCLCCLGKMPKYDHSYDGVILKNIRSHLSAYLKKGNSFKGKCLGIVSYASPQLAVWLLRKINYVR